MTQEILRLSNRLQELCLLTGRQSRIQKQHCAKGSNQQHSSRAPSETHAIGRTVDVCWRSLCATLEPAESRSLLPKRRPCQSGCEIGGSSYRYKNIRSGLQYRNGSQFPDSYGFCASYKQSSKPRAPGHNRYPHLFLPKGKRSFCVFMTC